MTNRRQTPFQHLVASAASLGGYPGGRRIREATQGADLEVRNQGDNYEIHLISQEAHSWAHSKLHDHPDIEAEFKSGDTIHLDGEHAREAVKLAKSAGLKVDGEVKEARRVREALSKKDKAEVDGWPKMKNDRELADHIEQVFGDDAEDLEDEIVAYARKRGIFHGSYFGQKESVRPVREAMTYDKFASLMSDIGHSHREAFRNLTAMDDVLIGAKAILVADGTIDSGISTEILQLRVKIRDCKVLLNEIEKREGALFRSVERIL